MSDKSVITPRLYRRTGPLVLISFIMGVLLVQSYVPGISSLKNISGELKQWVVIIALFAQLLAITILYVASAKHLTTKFAMNDLTFQQAIIALCTIVYVGSFYLIGKDAGMIKWLNATVIVPLGYSRRGLTSLFYLMWAYRRLRFTSRVPIFLGIGAISWILANTPIYQAIWPPITELTAWIWQVPSMSGTRGALLASTVGSLVLAFRALIGKESSLVEVES